MQSEDQTLIRLLVGLAFIVLLIIMILLFLNFTTASKTTTSTQSTIITTNTYNTYNTYTQKTYESTSKRYVKDRYYDKYYDDGYDLKRVLDKFGELVKRKGVKCFVIDPYNKVKLKGGSQNINDYTNEYLNLIDIFCRKYKAFIYLVAHPTKMQKEEDTL